MPPLITLRPASLADAPAIAALNVAVWRSAYVGMIAQPVLDAIDIQKRTQGFERALQIPERRTYVAMAGPDLAGFAISGPVRRAAELAFFVTRSDAVELRAETGEIYSIYTSLAHQGLGVGGRLLQESLMGLKEQGFQEVHIWALLENIPARKFYLKNGARETAITRTISLEGIPHEEGLLVVDL